MPPWGGWGCVVGPGGWICNPALGLSCAFPLSGSPSPKAPGVFHVFALVSFQRLNSLQELQLLEIMCNYFQEQTKDSVRQLIFSSLFSPQGNKADDNRMALLGKLVSMAVAVCRVPVLECAAFWLQVRFLCRQGRRERATRAAGVLRAT